MMIHSRFTFWFLLFLSCHVTSIAFARVGDTKLVIEYSDTLEEGDVLGINFFPPIGGRFFNNMMSPKTGQLDRSKHTILLKFNQTHPCFIPLPQREKLFSRTPSQGIKSKIKIGAKPEKVVTFYGTKHSKVNNLYNELVTNDYRKRNRTYLEEQIGLIKPQINDSFSNQNEGNFLAKDQPDPALAKIDQELEKLLAPFRKVNQEGLLSNEGLERMIVALYADFYSSTVVMATAGGSGKISEQQAVFLSHAFKDSIVNSAMLTRCKGGASMLIAYNSFLKNSSPESIHASPEFTEAFGVANASIAINTAEQQEFLLGRAFYLQEQMNIYDFDPANGFTTYKKMFPKSSFIPFIETVLPNKKLIPVSYKNSDHLLAKSNNSGVVLTMNDHEIVIDTNVQVTTVKDLLSRYAKAKFTFVDVWATWCIPCLKEFATVDATERIVNSRKGEMLYISIDKGDQRAQWIELIQTRKLKGTHVLVSPTLHEDLKKSYQVNTIPRYMIFDEKHQLFNKDAPRPSQQSDLINEFSKLK